MIDKREIIDTATALGRTPHVSARVSRVALSVGAALKGLPHRIAWRSALYEHDLVVHPARSIQVATERRVRTRTLSGRGLQVLIEPPESLGVGRVPWGASCLSDRHRAVLDARTASAACRWARGVGGSLRRRHLPTGPGLGA